MKLFCVGMLATFYTLLIYSVSGASRRIRKRKLVVDDKENLTSDNMPVKDDNVIMDTEVEDVNEFESNVKSERNLNKDMTDAFTGYIYDRYVKKYYGILEEALTVQRNELRERGIDDNNSMGSLLIDVIKVLASDILGAALSQITGIQTERSFSGDSIMDVIFGTLKKHTISKKMGCPV